MANKDYFIHPYNFIPLSGKVQRKPYQPGLARFSGLTGEITIRLETLTRLFIPDRRKAPPGMHRKAYHWIERLEIKKRNQRTGQVKTKIIEHPHYARFLRNAEEKYIIPGSSLKGMLRSVAEAMRDSCFTRADEKREHEYGDYAHSKCRNPQNDQDEAEGLCICCRIFGKVTDEKKKDDADSQYSGNFQGRASVSDAVLNTEEKVDRTAYTLKVLGTPKPREGEKYYYDANGQINGRKFYYHFHSKPEHFSTTKKSNQNCTIHESITEGAVFTFTVKFENLEEDELALLLYAILLDNKPGDKGYSMAHKIGMAKPLGFGSVHLSIERLVYWKDSDAFSALSDGKKTIQRTASNFTEELEERLKAFPNPFSGNDDRYNAWRFPKTVHPEKVHYPEKSWTQANHSIGLRLPRNGLFPINPADKDVEFVDEAEAARKIKAKTFEAIVIKPGKFAKCKTADQKEIEVFCQARTIKKGDTLLVYQNEKGVYMQFIEER